MSYNNASVIAVWGSPGSGKSTFSAILARYLTRDKSKAIIKSYKKSEIRENASLG